MSQGNLVARSPAKINLVLRVLGRRPDGYHELDTVFQAIDLWDTLEIGPSESLDLTCDHPHLPVDESNLVLRAARLLADRYVAGSARAALSLSKVLPLQGGLGGGSSNAAAALLLCNRFWSLGLSREVLEGLGAELGADVPYFLTGGTARGRGRGDRIEPLPFAGPLPVVLGCPPFGVPTRDVFEKLAGWLTLPGNGVSVFPVSAHKWPEDNDFGFLTNDLESVVFEEWPELRQFRDALMEVGAAAALLSGSGSAVFGVFPGEGRPAAEAERLGARFPGWRVLTTRFVDEGIRLGAPGEKEAEPNREA
jgi:4-diphosphocytidyl-2-C-methyl-D-erythritol kinase